MRKVLGVVVVVVVVLVVAAVAIGDPLAERFAEHRAAATIEAANPGSTATVGIASSPFLLKLATSGTISTVTGDVRGLVVGRFMVSDVHLTLHQVVLDRASLLSRQVRVRAIGSAQVVLTFTQAALRQGSGLDLTLGNGTIGYGPLHVPASLQVGGGTMTIGVRDVASLTVPLPRSTLLPCQAQGVITPGLLTLRCSARDVPPSVIGQAAAS